MKERERERDCEAPGQRMNWIQACCEKKRTFRRDRRFVLFRGMRWGALSFGFPTKPEHLRITTSHSTKSSLVGLYSFQGNLQSGGERLSWGVQKKKARQNAELKKHENGSIATSHSALQTKTVLTLKHRVATAEVLLDLASHSSFLHRSQAASCWEFSFVCVRKNCISLTRSCHKHAHATPNWTTGRAGDKIWSMSKVPPRRIGQIFWVCQ